jgi:hypothetical protein
MGFTKAYWQSIADEYSLALVASTWLSGLSIELTEMYKVQEILHEFVKLRQCMVERFSLDDEKFSFTLQKTDYFIETIKSGIESTSFYESTSLG